LDIIPPLRAIRFEELEPGDLFIHLDGQRAFYALRTQSSESGDQTTMVVLGPSFIQDAPESYLLPWRPATVVYLGNNFAILPSLNPKSWSITGSTREPVCLCVSGENFYICTNGGPSPNDYFPCFVEVKTGLIIEKRLPGSVAAFTNTWELVLLNSEYHPRSVLKYPLV
jgi:hypothetical protein